MIMRGNINSNNDTDRISNDNSKNDNNSKFLITKKIKKIYCVICGKYKKFEKLVISCFLETIISSFYL